MGSIEEMQEKFKAMLAEWDANPRQTRDTEEED